MWPIPSSVVVGTPVVVVGYSVVVVVVVVDAAADGSCSVMGGSSTAGERLEWPGGCRHADKTPTTTTTTTGGVGSGSYGTYTVVRPMFRTAVSAPALDSRDTSLAFARNPRNLSACLLYSTPIRCADDLRFGSCRDGYEWCPEDRNVYGLCAGSH